MVFLNQRNLLVAVFAAVAAPQSTVARDVDVLFSLGDCDKACVALIAPEVEYKAGDLLSDGTIYVDETLAVTPADAPDIYKWGEAEQYCTNLDEFGHNDWALPTREELELLHKYWNEGALKGTFSLAGRDQSQYWTSENLVGFWGEHQAWGQFFMQDNDLRISRLNRTANLELPVRCVR